MKERLENTRWEILNGKLVVVDEDGKAFPPEKDMLQGWKKDYIRGDTLEYGTGDKRIKIKDEDEDVLIEEDELGYYMHLPDTETKPGWVCYWCGDEKQEGDDHWEKAYISEVGYGQDVICRKCMSKKTVRDNL